MPTIIVNAQHFAVLPQEPVNSLSWNPDGTLLAAGMPEGWLLVIDGSGQELARWQADSVAVASIAWSPDGRQLATSGHDGSIRLWDAESWRLVREFGHYSYGATFISWSTDQSSLVGSGFDTFQI